MLLVIVVLASALLKTQEQPCPRLPKCVCYANLRKVNCQAKNLTTIPNVSEVPGTVISWRMDYNDFKLIRTHTFSGLKHLTFLSLNYNQIKLIEPFAFDGLDNLQILYLNGNELTILGNYTFADMPILHLLSLTTNKLLHIAKYAFHGTSNIRKIYVSHNNLSAVPSFGHQPYLEYISLSANKIVNAKFPVSFKNYSQIKYVHFDMNEIKKVTKEMFASLQKAMQLQLYLSYNAISYVAADAFTEFKTVASLMFAHNSLTDLSLLNIAAGFAETSLTYLDLSGNSFSGDTLKKAFSLFKNPSLKDLLLNSNNIHQLEENTFATFGKLLELDLSNCRIYAYSAHSFSGLDSLIYLTLAENFFLSVPKRLPTSLRYLNVNSNKIAYIESNIFENLCNLKKLQLRNNSIQCLQNDSFTGLEKLDRLDLADNNISHLPILVFAPLTQLTYLDLSNNRLLSTESQLNSSCLFLLPGFSYPSDSFQTYCFQKTAFKDLVSLQFLYLEGNCLGKVLEKGYGRKLLQGLKMLEKLDISRNEINRLPEHFFDDLESLTVLNLAHNTIDSLSLNTLGCLRNLRKLDLSSNMIDVVTRENAVNFKCLEELNLFNNSFTCDCDLLWFRDWVDVSYTVLLHKNLYTCQQPKEWRGKLLLEFDSTKINCSRTGELVSKDVIIGAALAGTIVSLFGCVCLYKCRWRIRLRLYLISKRRRHLMSTRRVTDSRGNYGAINNTDIQRVFDAYISSSEYDNDWVLKHLLPGIDNGQYTDDNVFGGEFRLYFDARDSKPGNKSTIIKLSVYLMINDRNDRN